ncbi:hypothetical protein [Hymenobacter psychrotolerans]|uniref:Uncharacterized protein n=1 Tax=Hymenobacter psychrotolerans DSM 18569 TaxID=1121959 RepID=A0A1M7E8A9_9BACT|nr:hypothetical protein [Hymenobacter psychrotolerans]SHL87900.1 hypothetical protein SAMN02746009_03548 [Hymenobacter psychrotolerans DSM 18569]
MAKNPIGFGRTTADPDPNGTGDGWRLHSGDAEEKSEQQREKPPRLPKAEPVYVGTIEGLEILGAYGLSPLAPLSNLEQQLLQVVAGLERKLDQYSEAS